MEQPINKITMTYESYQGDSYRTITSNMTDPDVSKVLAEINYFLHTIGLTSLKTVFSAEYKALLKKAYGPANGPAQETGPAQEEETCDVCGSPKTGCGACPVDE